MSRVFLLVILAGVIVVVAGIVVLGAFPPHPRSATVQQVLPNSGFKTQ